MVNTNKLRGAIAERRLSQAEIAKKMNIADKTFYRKMAVGVFDSNEMFELKEILELSDEDAIAIFFAPKVS